MNLSRSAGAAFVAFGALAAVAETARAQSAQSAPTPAPSAAPTAPGAVNATNPAAPMPAPSASPTASPSAPPHLFVLSGFGDVGYTAVAGTNVVRFINGAPSRIYDGVSGPFFDANTGRQLATGNNFNTTFDLQQANVQLAINDGPLTGKFEGLLGTDADTAASNGQSRSGTNLYQAYLAFGRGPATFTVGKMASFAGNEVLEGPSNTNYSRSYAYGIGGPFTVTGARLQIAPNSKIAVVAGVDNGWDDWKFVNKGAKTIEGAILLTPTPGYSLTLDTYNGSDFAVGATLNPATLPIFTNRVLYDGVLTVHPTGALSLIAQYDRAYQLGDATGAFTTARWNDFVGYVNYQLSPLYLLSLRQETFGDINGFRTGLAQRLQDSTATLSYSPGKYIFRAEYRVDSSTGNDFTYRNAPTDPITGFTAGRNHQPSLGFEAILKLQ